jgi:hypothetical protein
MGKKIDRKSISAVLIISLILCSILSSASFNESSNIRNHVEQTSTVRIYMGPKIPKIKGEIVDIAPYSVNDFLIMEKEISQDQIEGIEITINLINEKYKGKNSDYEIYSLINDTILILRNHSIVPDSFTLKNLSETIKIFIDECQNNLWKNNGKHLLDFNNLNFGYFNNDSYKIQNLGNRLVPLDSFFGLGTFFLYFQWFAQGQPIALPMTYVNETGDTVPLILPFNFSNKLPLVSSIRNIIGNRTEEWNLTGAGAIGGYKFQFLLVPSLLTFSYIFAILGFGGAQRPLFGDSYLKGPLISITGMFGGFSLTIIVENTYPGYIIQYPILEVGAFFSLGQAVGSLTWEKEIN